MLPTDGKPTPFRHARALARRRYFLLFLFLLASLIFYSYAGSISFGYYAFRVVGSAAIVLCVYVVSFKRSLLIVALILAVPPFLHRALNLSLGANSLSILNIALSFTFDVFIVVVLFRRVFAPGQPNSETIFGALSVYLLVGFAFASIYGMLAAAQPRAFYLDPECAHRTRPVGLRLLQFCNDVVWVQLESRPSPVKLAAYRRLKPLWACFISRY